MYSCCYMYQNFIPFKGKIIFHFMHIPPFVYPLIHWWTFELSLFLDSVNNPVMNIGVHISWVPTFHSFGYTPEVEFLDLMVILCFFFFFFFLRKHYTVYYSGYTILHSHQQSINIPISPHTWLHLLFYTFCLFSIMVIIINK